MKHVPSVIKGLENKRLEAIKRVMTHKDASAFRELATTCVEQVMKAIVGSKPRGEQTDYYDWGYRQGLLEAHRMYLALLEHVLNELENRKPKEVDEGETVE